MKPPIVDISEPVTLIGGGELGRNDLDDALSRAPRLIAADGGAGPALAAGHIPEAVIGDFDSLTAEWRHRIPGDRLFPIREQDSTDFDKALRSIRAPLILAVGFLGARVDHQLAAFNAVVRHANHSCILIGAHEVIFHVPARIEVPVARGDVVSLFPMRAVTGRSHGLEWPIDGLELNPGGRIGTSNRALGPVTIETDQPGLLAMVPRGALDDVIRALAPAQARAAE
ncbi:thiamine diphosphokinase [Jhaorihella thermophila]|uniref:Thiamine diphosphokinase n=1 Tax=Jhaorihella thermophila TaxID=488547 RepID=A0A1H5V779_9RHOB|nr:thiamine diphosphokinase [Jhaorihella thermophila]SEF83026.1 thiamine pyrophosphokinase [Jhaorihella thermophila]